ncbi:alpha/beta hydrolase [Chloroflexus aggregans]|uniref:Alpha/beta hydrolase fold-containing protein n=1 Tax=Chloroflexus aggregans (strain MD-66 / DSM 9485) TaxID=326427 RepID=B8G4W3_CHLAD|nr:alpha/beta fold hydrolase [Chloroflexus aggregans]ACL23596.1 alpha/beta hydrolase fold-containing protein [Chloroflexus aggregans DSM 9485]
MSLEWITAQPQRALDTPPVLLIHGAWHGAWCWAERALPDLAARGLTAHAISLRGHGASPPARWSTTICDYVADVYAAITALAQPPLLVGHSAGGYVAQLLMTGRCRPSPTLAGVVLLCSSPVSSPAYFLRRWREGAQMVDIRALLRRDPAAVRAALFRPDIPPADLERYRQQLVAEPPLVTMTSMLVRPRPTICRTPVLVIAAGQDAIFDIPAQQALAAAYHAELLVVPDAPHDVMLDPAWRLVGAAIAHFAVTVGKVPR